MSELMIASGEDLRMRLVRVAELVGRQFGVIARWQLLECGVTDTQIRGWLRVERMFRLYPGVYIWGRRDLPVEGRLVAGILCAGRGSALTGLTGLWWRKLLGREPDVIHIDTPGFAGSRQGLRIRSERRVVRETRRGMPLCPLPEMLMLSAADLKHDTLRLVLARAEYERILSLSVLESSLGQGRPGTAAIRRAMAEHLPQLARCTNRLEREYVLLCEAHGLPIPDPNEPIGRFRPDMLWRDRMLIVELDGPRAHSTPAQLLADAARQEFLESLGYTVIRFTDEDVFERPGWVMARTRAALAGA